MYRRFTAVVSIVVSLTLSGAPRALADDDGAGGDNLVHVQNDKDGAVLTRARTSVAHNPGPSVANSNEAFAYASCTDCRTVAAAVQVVLVEGPAPDFRPANVAVALNENCLRCATFAFARQVVLTPGHHVEIDDDAEDRIEWLQSRIRKTAASPASFPEMTATLDDLTEQLVAVVQAEVERAGTTAGRNDDRRVEKHDDEDD